jgi:hypothetical protein
MKPYTKYFYNLLNIKTPYSITQITGQFLNFQKYTVLYNIIFYCNTVMFIYNILFINTLQHYSILFYCCKIL